MAKKIRFPLKMANGMDVRTIEELRDNFDLTTVLGYYADGKLITWLRDRFYDTEADKIEALDKDSKSFQSDLCSALGIAVSAEGEDADSGELDMDYINRRNEKRRILRELTDDEQIIYNVDSVALNQDDLLDLYDEDKKTIYLCQGEFEIPLSVTDVTYIGVADPVVTIRVTDNVNFKEKNIRFENLCYGWDISSTTPNDDLRRAESLFMKGDCQKAADILKDPVERENPRAIMLAYRLYKDFLYDDEKLRYYENKAKQSQEIFNDIDHTEGSTEKYFPLLKKLADKGDAIGEFFYAKALNKDEWLKKQAGANAKEMFEYYRKNTKAMIEYYRKSADKGNIWALLDYGFWASGRDQHQDCREKIIEWYTKAAEMGCPQAQFQMWNERYEKDKEKRLEWLIKSAEQGCGTYMLGIHYHLEKNIEKAIEWWTKAAEQGDVHTQVELADRYYEGKGIPRDDEMAYKWYSKAAEQGNIKAQFKLANCYDYGCGVEEDKGEAVKWYTKVANQALPSADAHNLDSREVNDTKEYIFGAQNKLVDRYKLGLGVDVNYTKAVEWLTKAANMGNTEAQAQLGIEYYFYGDLVERDEKQAIMWLRKGMNSKSYSGILARYYLADYYCKNNNYEEAFRVYVEGYESKNYTQTEYELILECAENQQNYEQVFEWAKNAAIHGDSDSQFRLGDCYYYGITPDMEEDKDEAFKWYTKAANRGNSDAQFKLAICYYSGYGIDEDTDEYLKWLIKAAENGSNEALNELFEYDDEEADSTEFIKFLTKLADQGNANAQYKLAKCYGEGECGVEQDMKLSMKWCDKFAESTNDNEALDDLLDLYSDEDDYVSFFQSITFKLAKRGNGEALERIARAYLEGEGFERDITKALEYFIQAADQGQDVWDSLKEIALEMD